MFCDWRRLFRSGLLAPFRRMNIAEGPTKTHMQFKLFSYRIDTPKMPIPSCPRSLDGDWAQGVEPEAAQPHPRRHLDRTTDGRFQVATGVAQSLALHFLLCSTPLRSCSLQPRYPSCSTSNTTLIYAQNSRPVIGKKEMALRAILICFA